jgi:hypothetical protein
LSHVATWPRNDKKRDFLGQSQDAAATT